MHLVDLRGCTPPATCRQQGESFCPLQHRGPDRPKNVPEQKKTVCVLGMGCGCLAGALELHLTQVGARGNAFRALVFAYTPKWLKNLGVYPLFTISLNKLSGSRLPGAQIPGWYEYELGNCYSCP